jgi:7,8-dihydroneopterin aldolase/epimerase/oxygenase
MDFQPYASVAQATRRVFIRDLVLFASIGVHPHELKAPQRVRINLELAVEDDGAAKLSRAAVGADELSRVVDYEALAQRVRAIVAQGHVRLVETLAERLAETCLADARVRRAMVRVEKLDVFSDAASAGVEIERRNG